MPIPSTSIPTARRSEGSESKRAAGPRRAGVGLSGWHVPSHGLNLREYLWIKIERQGHGWLVQVFVLTPKRWALRRRVHVLSQFGYPSGHGAHPE
eukprot:4774555-Prymnesium_polylepis.1